MLRYRNREGLNPDGLTGEEGTFVICSFWLVSALAQAGELERADRRLGDRRGARRCVMSVVSDRAFVACDLAVRRSSATTHEPSGFAVPHHAAPHMRRGPAARASKLPSLGDPGRVQAIVEDAGRSNAMTDDGQGRPGSRAEKRRRRAPPLNSVAQ